MANKFWCEYLMYCTFQTSKRSLNDLFGPTWMCPLKADKNDDLMSIYYLSLVACILYFVLLPVIF